MCSGVCENVYAVMSFPMNKNFKVEIFLRKKVVSGPLANKVFFFIILYDMCVDCQMIRIASYQVSVSASSFYKIGIYLVIIMIQVHG